MSYTTGISTNNNYRGSFNGMQVSWDKKDLEIKTKSVEETLQPLINQITILASGNLTNRKKGRSKKASVLIQELKDSTAQFIKQGTEIANENSEMKDELLNAVNDVRIYGDKMANSSKEFTNDPFSSQKRVTMVGNARELLTAVARLLTLADMIDVHLLVKCINQVQQDLESIRTSNNQDELTNHFKKYGVDLVDLTNYAGKRQADLKDPLLRDELASARATLKKNSLFLFTTSKTLLRHPELSSAQTNQDYVLKEICAAVDKIHAISTNKVNSESLKHLYDQSSSLLAALDDLDRQILNMNPITFNESKMRINLETHLESIISSVALMADSESTRPNRRDRIVDECNALRQALQDLLNAYISNNNKKNGSAQIDQTTGDMVKMTKNLRRQLRKAIMDHVSDTFLETSLPLEDLIEAAKSGDQLRFEECIKIFTEHAEKLHEVAQMVCSMSNDLEGVKLVRMADLQVRQLAPQVVNAAKVLAARPTSKVALENMEVYRDAWQKNVSLLTDAVDDIITINDFLAVSESHILEDINRCVLALRERDVDTLDRNAGAIRARTARICNIVAAEMDDYEPCEYTNKVLDTVQVLRDQIIVNFARSVEYAINALVAQPIRDPDENEFIDASRLVYDGVRDVRNAVLLIRDPNYEVSDSDIDEPDGEYENENVQILPNIQEDEPKPEDEFKHLTNEQREQIEKQLEKFKEEKRNFEREVLKWDDKGNDIIVLAKQMCVIIMEMTDFTRGRGPLKTTMDIINAAKKISECGAKLDKLAKTISDECPESQSKRDLDAYLKQIPLFCNQLNIASKVKENVIDVSGEPIITGLDSATSLIISSKNLMNAVVSVVKASYVASTKYTSKTGTKKPIVQWRMKAPEKKPLVITAKPQEVTSRVRKASQKKRVEPIRELNEFQA